MSKRVLVLIRRSGDGAHVTDNTPVVCWEHEIPILEEVHGGEQPTVPGEGVVQVVEDYEILVDRTFKSFKTKAGETVTRSDFLAQRVKELGLDQEFRGEPSEEWSRMIAIYGMHPEVKMPYVEKVYGPFREGRFTDACGTETLEDLSLPRLRDMAEDMGVAYSPRDKKEAIVAAVRAAREAMRVDAEQAEKKQRRAA
jgi:hypothetical protein